MVPSTPLKIMRKVEVWQWVERRGEENRVSYTTKWCEEDVPSREFEKPGYQNPAQRLVDLHSSAAVRRNACLGAFSLSDAAVAEANWWNDAWVPPSAALSAVLVAKGARIENGAILLASGVLMPGVARAPRTRGALPDHRA